jgi:hypothetical protein
LHRARVHARSASLARVNFLSFENQRFFASHNLCFSKL